MKQFVRMNWAKARRHNRELINNTSRLADSDFIIRTIYKDVLVCIISMSHYVTLRSDKV